MRVARRRRNGELCAPNAARSSSMTFTIISRPGSVRSARKGNLLRRSVTRSAGATASVGSSITVGSISTLTRSSGRSGPSQEGPVRWARRGRRQLGGNRDAHRKLQAQQHRPTRLADWHPNQTRQRSPRQQRICVVPTFFYFADLRVNRLALAIPAVFRSPLPAHSARTDSPP